MRHEQLERICFAATACAVLLGVMIQMSVTADADEGYFTTVPARLFNLFCFFTVQSNVIVGITTGLLAIDLDRTSAVFRVFRLAGVIDIAVTGVVYHVALKDLYELDGAAALADDLLHVIVPLLAVVGWLVFGPRGLTSWRIVAWALAVPVVWMVFTLVRGPIVEWYPYPFIDVIDLGYSRVAFNAAVVAVVFVGLASGAHWLDGVLARRQGVVPVRS